MGNTYSTDECIEAIKKAEERLGESPSVSKYDSVKDDDDPSGSTIASYVGWNKAKEMAGQKTWTDSDWFDVSDVPDCLDISQEEWEEFSPPQRSEWRKKIRFAKMKVEQGCERCGYDAHPVSLSWHHPNDDKSAKVSTLIHNRHKNETIMNEIDKCELLCKNCHTREHSTFKYEVNADAF